MKRTSQAPQDPSTRPDSKQEDATLPKFKSLQDARSYIRNRAAREAAEDRRVKFWRIAERMTLVLVLAASFFNFYMLAVIEKIITLPHLEIPLPKDIQAPLAGRRNLSNGSSENPIIIHWHVPLRSAFSPLPFTLLVSRKSGAQLQRSDS